MSHDHVLSITVRAEVDEARRAFGSAIDALREMGVNTSALTDAFDTLHEALRDNQSQLKLIEIWKQLKREQQDFSKASLDAAKSADAYAKVCRDLESVRAQMSHLGTDVSALAQEHMRLKRAAAGIGDEFQAIAARADGLREASAHARTLAAELEQSCQEAMRLRDAQSVLPSTGIEEQTMRLREQLNVLTGVRKSWKEATRSQIEGLQSSLDKLSQGARAVASWRVAVGDVQRLSRALSDARERGEALARQMRAAGADINRDAGFTRVRSTIQQLESALASARARVKLLTPEMARLGLNTDRLGQSNAQLAARSRAATAAYTELSAKLRFARQSMSEMGRQANTVHGAMQGITASATTLHGALREIASGLAIGWSFHGAIEAADAYKNLTAQINLVNAAAPEMQVTMQQVTELAKTNHASLQDTVQLMMAVGSQSKELGISAQALTDVVQVIQQAGALGGQGAESTAAAVRQLIQALQSGVLRGEELNSVLEQAPRLARAIADGLGEPVSALRKLAAEGRLTADEVLRALLQQKQRIAHEFAELPVTADKAMQDVRNAFTLSIGKLDERTGISDAWVSVLKMLERNMEAVVTIGGTLASIISAIVAVKTVKGMAQLAKSTLELSSAMRTAADNAWRLWGAIKMFPTASMATLLASVVLIGMEIKKWRMDQELAEVTAAAERATNQRILRFQTEAHQWSQYKDTIVKTAAEVARMDAFGRDQYEDRLRSAIQYYSAVVKELQSKMYLLDENSKKATQSQLEEVIGKVRILESALKNSEKIFEVDANSISEIGAALSENLVEAFSSAKEKGQDAVETLSGLFTKELGTIDQISVVSLSKSFETLADKGKVSAGQIRDAFEKTLSNLSAEGLSALTENIAEAGRDALISVQGQAQLLRSVLDETFKRAGVDASVAMGDISEATQSALSNIENMRGALEASGASAQQTGMALEMAFNKALANAATLEDIEAINQGLAEMKEAGKLSAEAIARIGKSAEDARDRIERSIPGLQSVAEAMKQANIKSRAELEQLAAEAQERFAIIEKSGQASAAGLRKAFEDWVRTEAEANDGVISAATQAKAAMLGLQITVSETGDVSVQAMDKAAASVRSLAAAAGAAKSGAGASRAAGDAAEGAASAYNDLGDAAESASEKLSEAGDAAVSTAVTVSGTMDRVRAAVQGSQYAEIAIERAREQITQISRGYIKNIHDRASYYKYYASMAERAREIADSLEALDKAEANLGKVSGLTALQDRLLELDGTEEQIAQRRAQREREEVERQLEIARIHERAAQIKGDKNEMSAAAAERREAEEMLKLLDAIHRKEAKQRKNEAREAARAAKQEQAEKEKAEREAAQRAREQAAEKDRLNAENAAREAARNEEEHQRELARIAEQDAAKRREERQITQNTLLIEALNKIGHAQGASATSNPITINFNADGILDLSKGNVDQLARALVPRLNNLNRLGFKG